MNDGNHTSGSFLRIYSRLDSGPRPAQQDRLAYRASGNRSLLVLADGMGGHDSGEKAAAIATDAFIEAFLHPGSAQRSLPDALSSGLAAAERNIKANPAANMGTTIIAAILEESSQSRLVYTWIGDSRLYLLTVNGSPPSASAITAAADECGSEAMWLLTRDDSLIWDLYEQGEIGLDDLSRHSMKNRLRHSLFSRGGRLPARIEEARISAGDRLLLCTDGVWESFPTHREMLRCWSGPGEESHRALSAYLDAAVRSGSCTDNNSYLFGDLISGAARPAETLSESEECAR